MHVRWSKTPGIILDNALRDAAHQFLYECSTYTLRSFDNFGPH